jgi:hypothetical protein
MISLIHHQRRTKVSSRGCPARLILFLTVLMTIIGYLKVADGTIIVPTEDHHLIRQASAIVVGQVTKIDSHWHGAKTQIYTHIGVRIEEVLKGELSEVEITIKQLGGTVGELRSWIFGSPEFVLGERVLLLLTANPDRTLRVLSLYQGKFSVVLDSQTGEQFIYRNPSQEGVRHLARSGTSGDSAIPAVEMRPLSRFKAEIAAQVAQEQASARSDTLPVLTPPAGEIVESHERFTFLGSPSRWFEPDSNNQVSVFMNSQGEPNAPGGGFEQIRSAYRTWSTVIGSTFRFHDAGFTSAQGFSFDGINTVSFGDPLGQIDPPQGCSGTLAIGGYFRSTSQTGIVNGQTFFRILEGDLVFADGWQGCGFYEDFSNLAEVATHELGHVLGLGHSSDPNATMFAFAHFDGRSAALQSDDVAGLNFFYPKSVSVGQIQYADVNGDGNADALNFDVSGGAGIWVSLSVGNDATVPELWLQHGPSTPDQIQYVDVDGDGKADALYFDTLRSSGIWVSLSTGSAFTAPEMWLQHGPSTSDQIQYADVNGDGKADALYFDTFRSGGVWVSLSTGSGFAAPEMWAHYASSAPAQIKYLDIDGDGKADALHFDSGGAVRVGLSTGTGFTTPTIWLQHGASTPDQLQYVDVNGDGKVDAVYFDTSRSNGVWVSLSTGSSFSGAQLWLQHGPSTPDQIQYADVNGDGRADALYFDTLRSKGVWVSLSTGTTFAAAQLWLQHGDSTPDQIQYVDVNGDGKADALYFDSARSKSVWLSLSTGTTFSNGFLWLP